MSIPAGFKAPFRFDGICYVWDANGEMVADFNEDDDSRPRYVDGKRAHWNFRPRGWGRVQYLPDGERQMDEWAEWALSAVGDAGDPEEAVRRMNEKAGC